MVYQSGKSVSTGKQLPNLSRCTDRRTAEKSAGEKNIVDVGDGTYLLVLLCFYTRSDNCDLYFMSEPRENSRRRVWPEHEEAIRAVR